MESYPNGCNVNELTFARQVCFNNLYLFHKFQLKPFVDEKIVKSLKFALRKFLPFPPNITIFSNFLY